MTARCKLTIAYRSMLYVFVGEHLISPCDSSSGIVVRLGKYEAMFSRASPVSVDCRAMSFISTIP